MVLPTGRIRTSHRCYCEHVHRSVTNQSICGGKNLSSKIQVASRELGVPLSDVHLRGTSTETVPNANVSGGSVVADLNDLAVKVRITAVASASLTPSGPARGCSEDVEN